MFTFPPTVYLPPISILLAVAYYIIRTKSNSSNRLGKCAAVYGITLDIWFLFSLYMSLPIFRDDPWMGRFAWISDLGSWISRTYPLVILIVIMTFDIVRIQLKKR